MYCWVSVYSLFSLQVCKKCDKLWGTPTDSCYTKAEHNVVECTSNALTESTERIKVEDTNFEDTILQRNNNIPPVVLIHVF